MIVRGDNMTIKMVVTDMDGTLLDEKGEFDRSRLKNILDELDKREIRFVVATGNEIHRMHLLFGDLLERGFLIKTRYCWVHVGLRTWWNRSCLTLKGENVMCTSLSQLKMALLSKRERFSL